MAIRLLIADVDGTLVTPEKELTARSRRSVQRLRAAGVELAITSGRPPRGMAMLVGPLSLTTPVAGFNGGMLVSPDLATVYEQRTLPTAVAQEVLARLMGAGLDVWVYRGHDWCVRGREAPHVQREERTVQFAASVVPRLEDVIEGAIKIVGVSDDYPLVARCEADLRRAIGGQASVARSQSYYLDVTHPEANKAMVARHLSRLLQVPLQEIAVIGDMPNDVLMFGLAGLSIAMGNASPEVQRCARRVTSSNEHEGFANAVDWFILEAKSHASSTDAGQA